SPYSLPAAKVRPAGRISAAALTGGGSPPPLRADACCPRASVTWEISRAACTRQPWENHLSRVSRQVGSVPSDVLASGSKRNPRPLADLPRLSAAGLPSGLQSFTARGCGSVCLRAE